MVVQVEAIATALWRRALPEERVLFACLRQDLDAGSRARLLACAAAVSSWDAVLRTAVQHQVAPLVLHALGQAGALPGLPETVRAALHHEMLGNVAAKATIRRALTDALAWFAAEAVDAMPVKGTSLDFRLRDPALTTSGDIDLLLRQDWGEVDARVHQRVATLKAGKPVIDVDLARHPDLVMNGVLAVDFGAIWARARRTAVDGVPMFVMSAEHELLCACIQSARKRFFRLKSLFELAELLRGEPGLDWDLVARNARAWRCAGITFTALVASAAAAGAPIPEDLDRRLGLSWPRARLLAALVRRMSFAHLSSLHGGLALRGKRVGRGLLLVYASLGVRGAGRAFARALTQVVRRTA